MAEFECKVYELKIEEHPNADALELAVVGDYRSIVRKGEFKTGDLGVYIPEAAIVPDWLIEELGLTGRLAGKNKNRVKAVKLRGSLSQGLIVPTHRQSFMGASFDAITKPGEEIPETLGVREGDDVTEFLGITKYEPPIPSSMSGEVYNALGCTLHYDIENVKKYPGVLVEGEDEVVFTEKIHGTWACFGYHPKFDIPIVTSKGLSAKGLAFKFNEQNEKNLYVQVYKSLDTDDRWLDLCERFISAFGLDLDTDEIEPFYLLGEIFGQGVQDLTYGYNTKQFRVFDIYIGHPGNGRYLDWDEFEDVCKKMELETVPVLYRGTFYKVEMERWTNGTEVVSGEDSHIREGIVITPTTERRDDEIGRVKLKSVSEAYLLRKGGTEFN